MTWDGDISKMGRLADNIGRLASVPAQAAAAVSEDIDALIQEEFDVGADPYGNTWQPLTEATLKKRTQTFLPPLQDTQAMRETLSVRPMAGAGVAVTIAHPAEDHQTGWSGPQGKGPARPILPGGTFPARWSEVIRGDVDKMVKREANR